MGSSLTKQLVTQTDTSSLSPAAVQVLSTPLIAGSARLHPPLHRTVGITANSDLVVERSSNTTRGDGRRQSYFYVIIIIDNFCIALFSGVHKLTALYNILRHFLSFTNIIHITMTTNNV